MGFTNPFFSAAGQKERISNVGNYLLDAVPGVKLKRADDFQAKGIIEKSAQFVAENPLKVAAVGATAYNVAAKGIIYTASNVGKALMSAAKTTVKNPVKVIGGAAGYSAATGYISSKPEIVSNAPAQIQEAATQLNDFGADVGNIQSGSDVLELVQEHPIISTAIVGGTAAAIGAKAAGSIVTTASNLRLKSSIEQQQQSIEAMLGNYSDNVARYNAPLLASGSNEILTTPSNFSSTEPAASENPVVATPSPKDVQTNNSKARSPIKYKKSPPIRISNRNINILQVKRGY